MERSEDYNSLKDPENYEIIDAWRKGEIEIIYLGGMRAKPWNDELPNTSIGSAAYWFQLRSIMDRKEQLYTSSKQVQADFDAGKLSDRDRRFILGLIDEKTYIAARGYSDLMPWLGNRQSGLPYNKSK